MNKFCPPQTDATIFASSSNSILLLWSRLTFIHIFSRVFPVPVANLYNKILKIEKIKIKIYTSVKNIFLSINLFWDVGAFSKKGISWLFVNLTKIMDFSNQLWQFSIKINVHYEKVWANFGDLKSQSRLTLMVSIFWFRLVGLRFTPWQNPPFSNTDEEWNMGIMKYPITHWVKIE